ncbi:2'-5' RNA ligase family protein [Mammaliicoccus sp. Dog046]|uniref:2'-5' RNA ligase family protein n=1 Tax=Mammaliicoccus sp. Dog046 TaxID=3034233 RepID=UPI002B264676|nr:2'-5' RNA ligase family protein [Mammaliicoccus sp. Dog046]WQK85252.1 2'-5' RNA ligase family protein [Mammaliicoccus sp. Dog046]
MYFLGIVPPERIYKIIIDVQQKYMEKIGVEPHITLKAQSCLTNNHTWFPKVEKVIKTTEQFLVKPKGLEFFGEEVLYVSLESQELKTLHNQLINVLEVPKQYREQYFEGELFVPHITIGKVDYFNDISSGMNYQTLLKIKNELLEKIAFEPFLVEQVVIYEYRDDKYIPYQSIDLNTTIY